MRNRNYIVKCFLGSLVLIFESTVCLFSQDSSNILKEVYIFSNRINTESLGQNTKQLDSSLMQLNSNTMLSDVLMNSGLLFVKAYGNCGISSTSLRGGNASQSQVNWNGFSFNNPMLGQTDFSLLPVAFFDEISVQYGGNSAYAGSGSVAGTILLADKNHFNEGSCKRLTTNYASTGSVSSSIHLQFSGSKLYSSSKAFFLGGNNNYTYYSESQELKRRANNRVLQYGIKQDFGYHQNGWDLAVKAFYTSAEREIPSGFQANNSYAVQTDKNLRSFVELKKRIRRLCYSLKTGLFLDAINYKDAFNEINSASKSFNWQNEGMLNYFYLKNQEVSITANASAIACKSNSYDVSPKQKRFALNTTFNGKLFKQVFAYRFNIRKEWVSAIQNPITFSAGMEIVPFKFLRIHASSGNVYRLPTMNDLYWNPGGNPDLKPEKGFQYDAGITLYSFIKKAKLTYDCSYFNRKIEDWIAWLPASGNNWSPINVLEVDSRGFENDLDIRVSVRNVDLIAGVHSNYIRSTYEKNSSLNDVSKGRQLIYTPVYSGQARLGLNYSKFSLLIFGTYTGYRYLSSDNYDFLEPYNLLNASTAYSFEFRNCKGELRFLVNNIMNRNYHIVAAYPMPLRNYSLTLKLEINENPKK